MPRSPSWPRERLARSQVGTLRPEAQGALTYRRAVTALAFAPESTMLAAGHDDGSVTTQSIDVSAQQADERVLTSANGPVDAVAAATNGSTALAVHASGTVSVWDLTIDRSEPWARQPRVFGPGRTAHGLALPATSL